MSFNVPGIGLQVRMAVDDCYRQSVLMPSPSTHFSEEPLMSVFYSRICFIQLGLTV